ncbi:MAG: PilN domain-containing protein [Cytophagales bacterium]|nr:PilN domain-containing protein [Armatimonadota bacterium]
MPNINLIAVRREEKKRLERITRQLFFGLAASVGVMVLLGTYLTARRFSISADLADAEAKMQKLQPTLDRIAEVEAQTNELKPKVETLQTAKTETLRWRSLFTVVSQSIPDSAWITSLSSSGGDTGMITLNGTAASQTLVGDTMTRLGSHPVFDKIDLSFTQSNGQSTDLVQQVTFQINAHLRPPTEKKDDTKKDGAAGDQTKTASGRDSRKETGNDAA